MNFLKSWFTGLLPKEKESELSPLLNDRQKKLLIEWRGEGYSKIIMKLEQRIYELEESNKQ